MMCLSDKYIPYDKGDVYEENEIGVYLQTNPEHWGLVEPDFVKENKRRTCET